MIRPELSEWDWKPEYVLGHYRDAIQCAEKRGDEIARRALKSAFICNWNRVVLRCYGGANRL